jgi:RimJ/RimL family protein N-acetyltransferase
MIINWSPNNLEDSLIRLFPIVEADFDILFEIASDPMIWEQHPVKDRYKKEVFQTYFDGVLNNGYAFLIIEKATNKVIGSTSYYNYNPNDSSITIGYTFLARHYWGKAYNRSSKKLLIDYAFQFVDKVYFYIGGENIRSQLATSKIGAKKVGEVDLDYNGIPMRHYEYLIEKEDWGSTLVLMCSSPPGKCVNSVYK